MGCVCVKEDVHEERHTTPGSTIEHEHERRAAGNRHASSVVGSQHQMTGGLNRNTTSSSVSVPPQQEEQRAASLPAGSASPSAEGRAARSSGARASDGERAANPLVGRPPTEADGGTSPVTNDDAASPPSTARRGVPSPAAHHPENPQHTPTDTTTLTTSRSANSSINSTTILDDEQQQHQQPASVTNSDVARYESKMTQEEKKGIERKTVEVVQGVGMVALPISKETIARLQLTVTTASAVTSAVSSPEDSPLPSRHEHQLPPVMALNDDVVGDTDGDGDARPTAVGGAHSHGLPPLPPPSVGSGSARTATTTTTTNATTTTTSSTFGSHSSDGHRNSSSGLLTPPGSNRVTVGAGGFLGTSTPAGTMTSSVTPFVSGSDTFIPLRSKRRPTAETDDASSFLHVGGFKRSSVSSSLPTHSSSHSLRTLDTLDRNNSFFDRRASRDLYSATSSPMAGQRVVFETGSPAGGGGGVDGSGSSNATQSGGSSSIALPSEAAMSSPFRQHRVPSHSGAVSDEAVMDHMRMRMSPTSRQHNLQGRGFTMTLAPASASPSNANSNGGVVLVPGSSNCDQPSSSGGGGLQIHLSQCSLGSMVSSRNNVLHGVRPPPQITAHQMFPQRRSSSPTSVAGDSGGAVGPTASGVGGGDVSSAGSGYALPISSGRHATAKPLQSFPAIGVDAASPYSTPGHRSTRSQNSFHLEPVNSTLYRQPLHPSGGGSVGDFNDSLTTPSVLLSGRHGDMSELAGSGEEVVGGMRRCSDAPASQPLPVPPARWRGSAPGSTAAARGEDDFTMPIHPKRLVVAGGGTSVDGGTPSVVDDDVISVSSFTSTSAGVVMPPPPPPPDGDDAASQSASDRTLPPPLAPTSP